MKGIEYDLSAPIAHLHSNNAPYSFSLASSASTSSSSVWSNASSQSSNDSSGSSLSVITSDSDSCSSQCLTLPISASPLPAAKAGIEVAVELRQNPRRTTRPGCPPALVRQDDRRVNFVDNLVDSSTQIIEAIWPTSSVYCRTSESGSGSVLPLRTFIQETLRRSRTSYSTLQVALYYLILIKPHVPRHDFTMEQPDDCHTSRSLQCGRRMFLAALILASKYLQDRNYSSRAWSKISGLGTQELNQNELAFLLAVNWKLHITEEVYNRWTDCVSKFPPPPSPPSSPGIVSLRQYERQCEEYKGLILQLTPGLDNLEDLIKDLAPRTPTLSRYQGSPAVSPRSFFPGQSEKAFAFGYESVEATPTHRTRPTPSYMEPSPALARSPGRQAPALGLLPTPRLTPQASTFNTPAVSAASKLLGRGSSMGYAMAQASTVNAAQALDRWPGSTSTSPVGYLPTRRSSLANSLSTVSSPESMVSDISRTSRSSSISSASSLVSAPSAKLDVQARYRSAKLSSDRVCMRPTITSVPEDYEETHFTSSPESYTGPVGKDVGDIAMPAPRARRGSEIEANDAARALQNLQYYRHPAALAPPATLREAAIATQLRAGLKRSRPASGDNALQDNVREILRTNRPSANEASWPDAAVHSRQSGSDLLQVPVRGPLPGSRKRLCLPSEIVEPYLLHPSLDGMSGPGMWEGILN